MLLSDCECLGAKALVLSSLVARLQAVPFPSAGDGRLGKRRGDSSLRFGMTNLKGVCKTFSSLQRSGHLLASRWVHIARSFFLRQARNRAIGDFVILVVDRQRGLSA